MSLIALALDISTTDAQTPLSGLIKELTPTRAPFGDVLAFRVMLQRPLEEAELTDTAMTILTRFQPKQRVYLYFALPGWAQRSAIPLSELWYARYERDRDEERVVFRASPPSFVRSQLSKIELRPGETIRGIWIDHYLLGHDAISVIVVNAKSDTYRLSSEGMRWRMVDKGKRRGNRWMVSIPETKTDDTSIGLMFASDGSLHLFDFDDPSQTKDKPVSIATPWSENSSGATLAPNGRSSPKGPEHPKANDPFKN